MNTTMADGAAQRLVAQIAEGLFGQPGLTLMELENRVRLARAGGGPLLCGSCYGLGVIGYTSGQTPEQFEQGEYPCPDCAQPSPAGQGDAPWPEIDMILADAYSAGAEGLQFEGIARRAAVRAAVAALTARQPVASNQVVEKFEQLGVDTQPVGQEPIGRVYSTDGVIGIEWRDGMRPPAGAMLYAAPPAQDVDLGQPNKPGRTLYVDLDGVMADFDGAFPAVFGLDHRSLADNEMWGHINGHPSFFRDLPPMAGAVEFFRSIEHMNPVILTACPKSNYPHVAAQKRAWVREHLSATCLVLPVLGGRHKPLFMHQAGDVLIDDFGKNCEAWNEAHGIAIKHEGDWTATRLALASINMNAVGK